MNFYGRGTIARRCAERTREGHRCPGRVSKFDAARRRCGVHLHRRERLEAARREVALRERSGRGIALARKRLA